MKPCRHTKAAFTLIELMASMAILGVMTFLLFSAFDQTSKAWLQGESRVETYSSARAALDYMSRELAQAVVNTNAFQFFGTSNAVAFIVSSSDNLTDAVDVAEIVYRLNQISASAANTNAAYPGDPFTNNAPPYKLMRRSSVYSIAPNECWDYGQNQSCSFAWDFYSNPLNWMETSQSNRVGVLAENIMSLTFQYVSANDLQNPYNQWNSTNVVNVWKYELPNNGLPNNILDINGDALSYTNMIYHAPAGVYITIGAIDSRTAARLQAIAPNGTNVPNVNIGAYTNTLNQAERFFTTFVEIPNQ
jgi:prepilin-type N-terminal cleavage/methylation domain-containing protein